MVEALMVKGESHAIGGPGRFLLGRSELMAERLLAGYGGKVKLIYLDPPFGTGDTFSLKLSANKKRITQPVYCDALSREEHLAMMRAVLEACRGMLSDDGSIYLHMDHRLGAKIRLMMDEIFGESNFMNEIIWSYRSGGRSMKHYSRKHDTILFYRKGPSVQFDITAVGAPRGPKKRNNMKRSVDEDGRVFFSIRSGGKIYTYYEDTPIYPSDVWDDIEHLHQRDPERTGYATQKPEALLRRVISASSKPGDLVADLFSGSGTTAAVASAMDRRFLAVDASPIALYTLRKRQLTAHASTRMFLDAGRIEFEYDAPHALGQQAPRTELLIKDRSGATQIEIGAYRGSTALAYLAAGRVEGGMFRPWAYELNPLAGMRLSVPGGDGIVIQECDFDGSQIFYAL